MKAKSSRERSAGLERQAEEERKKQGAEGQAEEEGEKQGVEGPTLKHLFQTVSVIFNLQLKINLRYEAGRAVSTTRAKKLTGNRAVEHLVNYSCSLPTNSP